MASYVARGLQTASPAYHTFLANTVQPNIALFAELVRVGEVLVGLALVLGALTRVGGFFGIVLTAELSRRARARALVGDPCRARISPC